MSVGEEKGNRINLDWKEWAKSMCTGNHQSENQLKAWGRTIAGGLVLMKQQKIRSAIYEVIMFQIYIAYI